MPADAVSVVIPAYNYAHFLPDAIASILEQTHPAYEIIVVDDGSKDNTREVVARFTDPRVRYVWQQNAGLSAARNTGIAQARTPFVAFLDADDQWFPGFLSAVVERFQALEKRYGLVATATTRMDQSGQKLPPPRRVFSLSGTLTPRDFIMRNRCLSSSIVARRAVFDECGFFDTTLRSSEDRDMWIRITTKYGFWLIDEPLGYIRRHGDNMSKNAPRMKQNSGTVMVKAWRAGAVSRWDVPFWLRAFSVHYFQIAWTHYEAGYRARAFQYLATSVALWPVFLKPAQVFEPPLFRLRALAHFVLRLFSSARS